MNYRANKWTETAHTRRMLGAPDGGRYIRTEYKPTTYVRVVCAVPSYASIPTWPNRGSLTNDINEVGGMDDGWNELTKRVNNLLPDRFEQEAEIGCCTKVDKNADTGGGDDDDDCAPK